MTRSLQLTLLLLSLCLKWPRSSRVMACICSLVSLKTMYFECGWWADFHFSAISVKQSILLFRAFAIFYLWKWPSLSMNCPITAGCFEIYFCTFSQFFKSTVQNWHFFFVKANQNKNKCKCANCDFSIASSHVGIIFHVNNFHRKITFCAHFHNALNKINEIVIGQKIPVILAFKKTEFKALLGTFNITICYWKSLLKN